MKENWYEDLMNLTPEEFEKKRLELIEEFLSEIPEDKQQKYRALQWRIDGLKTKFKHPVAYRNKLFELMWNSFFDFHEALQGLNLPEDPKPKKDAAILKFKK